MLPDDQTALTLIVLVALVVVGFGIVFIGQTMKNDARVGIDDEYHRSRKRRGNRYVVVGALMALACAIGAVVMALLAVMPIQR
jgi:hypothetical protein